MKKRIEKTMDGNAAAAHVSYAFTRIAAIYPITPSSPMAELVDKWAAEGRKNLFGEPVQVVELQSEAGAAATLHGALTAGALASTYTASQGLLLMIPNIYKIAGELLPAVFHVAARTVATHALSIFGDHSDVYACRQTGAAMLASGSVQEVMDLSPVAHLSAISGRVPFINFFDGFRTSHEVQKIGVWDYDDLKDMLDMEAVRQFEENALNPEHAFMRGSSQSPDIFFQAREACNSFYDRLPDIVQNYMERINRKLGTNYGLFDYYGSPEAKHVIVAMGSVTQTTCEVIDYLNDKAGIKDKVGLIKVHLYRPFSVQHFINAIPDSVELITVLDRTKEPGSVGEPLFTDVVAALSGTKYACLPIFGGRYGLSSKDTTPEQIIAVYANHSKPRFTIGIKDDVTRLSLSEEEGLERLLNTTSLGNLSPETICCKFWGLGGDGTIGANKNSIKIIGNNTDLHVQAYFSYDSKKSGGVTVSHLRFGKTPIRAAYLVRFADFVACHNQSYILKYDMLSDLREGGCFLLNCIWEEKELENKLPDEMKYRLAVKNIHFYIVNAVAIGKEIGINGKINTILQSAFFRIICDRYGADYGLISYEKAVEEMKAAAKESYEVKGEKIVEMNYRAIDLGGRYVREVKVPECWRECGEINDCDYEDVGKRAIEKEVNGKECSCKRLNEKADGGIEYYRIAEPEKRSCTAFRDRADVTAFVENIQSVVNAQKGDLLPVSAFLPYVDGTFPSGSSAHEKRDFAVELPDWIPENCIQCNRCSYVCPHAVIRPAVLNDEELKNAPKGMEVRPMNGMPGQHFAIVVSSRDCTGCGSCAGVCPGMRGNKALEMVPLRRYDKEKRQEIFNYTQTLSEKEMVHDKFPVHTVKGSQFKKPLMEFSGACAGCGETPYAKLATQLFGERMYIANATGCTSIWANSTPSTAYSAYPDGRGPAWANSLFEDAAEFGYGMYLASKRYKDKTVWIFGGDGWAYDIGYGGLDHVLASGANINILVFDTEVYSNTGGQASKATPKGARARFATNGKSTPKKNLAAIAMTYGNVYVAQVAMGADYEQTVKAFTEAEKYDGPSLIIAYCTCIAHGIRAGMGSSNAEEKKAVEAGYWQLFRYNPQLAAEGKEPLIIDSKEPQIPYEEFLGGEIRYDGVSGS